MCLSSFMYLKHATLYILLFKPPYIVVNDVYSYFIILNVWKTICFILRVTYFLPRLHMVSYLAIAQNKSVVDLFIFFYNRGTLL